MATCSQVEASVVSLYRNFQGSLRDLLVSGPSSHEKHLEIFSKILSLKCLATCLGNLFATWFSHEKCVFYALGTVFKILSIFPSFILTIHCLVRSSLSQTHRVTLKKSNVFLHHLFFKLQEKVWVFHLSQSISCL